MEVMEAATLPNPGTLIPSGAPRLAVSLPQHLLAAARTAGKKRAHELTVNLNPEDIEWVEMKALDGTPYWQNSLTKQTTWERPTQVDEEMRGEETEAGGSKEEPSEKRKGNETVCQRLGNSDWFVVRPVDGNEYYYDRVTRATQWECPIELQTAPRGDVHVFGEGSSGGVKRRKYVGDEIADEDGDDIAGVSIEGLPDVPSFTAGGELSEPSRLSVLTPADWKVSTPEEAVAARDFHALLLAHNVGPHDSYISTVSRVMNDNRFTALPPHAREAEFASYIREIGAGQSRQRQTRREEQKAVFKAELEREGGGSAERAKAVKARMVGGHTVSLLDDTELQTIIGEYLVFVKQQAADALRDQRQAFTDLLDSKGVSLAVLPRMQRTLAGDPLYESIPEELRIKWHREHRQRKSDEKAGIVREPEPQIILEPTTTASPVSATSTQIRTGLTDKQARALAALEERHREAQSVRQSAAEARQDHFYFQRMREAEEKFVALVSERLRKEKGPNTPNWNQIVDACSKDPRWGTTGMRGAILDDSRRQALFEERVKHARRDRQLAFEELLRCSTHLDMESSYDSFASDVSVRTSDAFQGLSEAERRAAVLVYQGHLLERAEKELRKALSGYEMDVDVLSGKRQAFEARLKTRSEYRALESTPEIREKIITKFLQKMKGAEKEGST